MSRGTEERHVVTVDGPCATPFDAKDTSQNAMFKTKGPEAA